ncbi:MAG: hypothetical protein HY059_09960 [Proteobacteria bacterium]|nr:hypothetical protein [Pseudomonadota bacterium]
MRARALALLVATLCAISAGASLDLDSFIPAGHRLTETQQTVLVRALDHLALNQPVWFAVLQGASNDQRVRRKIVDALQADGGQDLADSSRLSAQLLRIAQETARAAGRDVEKETFQEPGLESVSDREIRAFVRAHMSFARGENRGAQLRTVGQVLQEIKSRNPAHYRGIAAKLIEKGPAAFRAVLDAAESSASPSAAADKVLALSAFPNSILHGAIGGTVSAAPPGRETTPPPIHNPAAVTQGPAADDRNPNSLAALLRADGPAGERKRDAAAAFNEFLWEARLGDKSFVKTTYRAANDRDRGVHRRASENEMRDWVGRQDPAQVAILLYVVLDGQAAPPWVRGVERGSGRIRELLASSLEDKHKYASRDQFNGQVGSSSRPGWVRDFLNRALERAKAILDPKSNVRANIRGAEEQVPVPGSTAGNRVGPAADLGRVTSRQLFGTWGEIDVVRVKTYAGGYREISIRLITVRDPKTLQLSNRIAVYDVTDAHSGDGAGEAYGLTLPLRRTGKEDFALCPADLCPNPMKYTLKYESSGEDTKIMLSRSDGKEHGANRDGRPITIQDLYRQRRKHTEDLSQEREIDGKTYVMMPQSAGALCFQFTEKTRFERGEYGIDLHGCTMKVNERGQTVPVGREDPEAYLGTRGVPNPEGEHYWLVRKWVNGEQKWTWERRKDPPKERTPAPAPAPAGERQPTDPGRQQQPERDTQIRTRPDGWPDFTGPAGYVPDSVGLPGGYETEWPAKVAELNRKLNAKLQSEIRFYVSADKTRPAAATEKIILISKKAPTLGDAKVAPWLGGEVNNVGLDSIDVVFGKYVYTRNHIGHTYVDLEKALQSNGAIVYEQGQAGVYQPGRDKNQIDRVTTPGILEHLLVGSGILPAAEAAKAKATADAFLADIPAGKFGTEDGKADPSEEIKKPEALVFQGTVAGASKQIVASFTTGTSHRECRVYPKAGCNDANRATAEAAPEASSVKGKGILMDEASPAPLDRGFPAEVVVDERTQKAPFKMVIPETPAKAAEIGAAIYEGETKDAQGDTYTKKWVLIYRIREKSTGRELRSGPHWIFASPGTRGRQLQPHTLPPEALISKTGFGISGVTVERLHGVGRDRAEWIAKFMTNVGANQRPDKGALVYYYAPSGTTHNCGGVILWWGAGVNEDETFQECSAGAQR